MVRNFEFKCEVTMGPMRRVVQFTNACSYTVFHNVVHDYDKGLKILFLGSL